MGKHVSTSSGKGGTKKKPTRQASLLRKPVIEVRGRLGKAQKSKKKKLKKIGASSADFYEAKVDGDREKTTREESRVINAAPKNLDQEMPKKLRMLVKAQKEAAVVEKLSNSQKKARQLDKYKKQQESVNSWFKRPVAKIPKFERKPGESDRAFYGRVEHESNDFMKIARFENENEVKVVQKENGEIEVEKRAKRKQIKNKEFREKKKAKKLKTLNDDADVRDFSDLTDEVKFNERNERPPEDLARPRKATEKTNKAEKLASFKFMGLMGSTIQSDKKKSEPVKSLAYKERMQEERQRVIEMYRNIKAKKRTGIVT